MASNSLLECLVFADRACEDILRRNLTQALPEIPDWDDSQVIESKEEIMIAHNWDEVRRFMWNYVGIVRTTQRLKRVCLESFYELQ
jgi:L-aspartate oxidase